MFFIGFREREEVGAWGRERNIDVSEKHLSIASHPDRGWNPQPFGVPDDAPTNGATQPGTNYVRS